MGVMPVALCALLATAAFAAACGIFGVGPDEDEFVRVTGRVFATATFRNGTTDHQNPVAGAIVSTSLDSATATTDSGGNFDLRTQTPASRVGDCGTYTVTITAAGHPTYSVTGAWGAATGGGNQQFVLSPPTPSIVGCQCPNPPAACRQ
ncbi:MAG: hypothetical protein HY657_15265 [Acidobacteria bacterium]|nr:hypothetical protein [Acidobacteriota bacterium]